jgi:DNA modification methylase
MCKKKVKRLISLVNQDCKVFLKGVASNSVDLVLVDPPYGISRSTGFSEIGNKGVERLRISCDFGEWDYDSDNVISSVIPELYRVLKKSGTLICFYDLWKITELKTHLENSGFKQLRFLEWLKTNPVPVNQKVNYLTNCREIALSAVKGGKPTFNSKYDNGIYRYPIPREGRFHPTQKPLRLISDLIEKHSNKNDLVLDCFSGSGTTAHACINCERNFIGCEIDKNYFDKAQKRIDEVL